MTETLTDRRTVEQQTRETILENEDPIETLITPDNLHKQDIDNWNDADVELLEEEVFEGLSEWSLIDTHPYENTIEKLAVSYAIDAMVRIPFEHLVFESRVNCVEKGYWLHDMSSEEVTELMWESYDQIHHEHVDEAMEFVESCVMDARLQNIQQN